MQRQNVQHHQGKQHNRNSHNVQREELVHRGRGQQVIAAHPGSQAFTDFLGVCRANERQQIKRNRARQGDNYLGTPVGHVAPGQHITEEAFGHQRQVDQHTEDPHQLPRRLVGAVHQATEHVQVHHSKERRRAHCVHVTDQPAPLHITHDVFNGGKPFVGREEHGQPDAGEQLVYQHHDGEHTKVVPEVEVLRRIVFGHVTLVGVHHGQTGIYPIDNAIHHSHHALVSPSSEPTITTASLR